MATCRLCAGTGTMLLMNSWFTADGLRRERCHWCGGTKKATTSAPPDWVKRQREMRERMDTYQKTGVWVDARAKNTGAPR